MERKSYSVYRITLPSGNQYVGYTSMTVNERWKNHIKRAKSGECKDHPFYKELKMNAIELCKIETLHVFDDRVKAMNSEREEITKTPKEYSLNISPGGVEDASFGGKIFWERLNSNPEKRKIYLKKLSDTKKRSDWTDYDDLLTKAKEWRKKNPKEAYKISYRASRVSRRTKNHQIENKDNRTLKEQLMHKHKMNVIKSQYVSEVWKKRSEDERKKIGKKISVSQKKRMAQLSYEEKRESTSKARTSINREKQGAAASIGIKKFWAELKQNPTRYEEYINRRRETLLKTLNRKKMENEDI